MAVDSEWVAARLAVDDPQLRAQGAHDEGYLQCHDLACRAERFAGLRAIKWNEAKWDAVSKALTASRARWPRFSNAAPRELLVDIADGSVNGHSFLMRGGQVVDPYMALRGVSQRDIQKLGRFLLRIYRRVGMAH